MESLADKVVLITGASAGIGEGTAVLFARLRSKLCLTGRNKENLQKVVDLCKSEGVDESYVTSVAGDLTDEIDRHRILQHTINNYGRLDVLVNNAGIIMFGNTAGITPEQYDAMMDTNVRSHFFFTQAALPYLKESKGNIVNVSSIAGQKHMPEVTAYCMTKAAMDSFTQCLALELGPFGVRVNSVNPGTVVSMINRREYSAFRDDKDYEKFLAKQKAVHPLGRVGVPQDVAQAIAFLASDQASFISGQLMFIDGARHCVSAAVPTSVK